MNTAGYSIEKQVKKFCAQIGADPLLVQGAGGNVSWKDGGVLWVKASGTWLAEAESKEIFVPVKLAHLQDALAKQEFSVKPEVNSKSHLRPSIETLLHALMPHKVVVHLHAIEVLAYLVRIDAKRNIDQLLGDVIDWIFVDYFRPGVELAQAVSDELSVKPKTDVVFMGNHGVLIGGQDSEEIADTLRILRMKFVTPVPESKPGSRLSPRLFEWAPSSYRPCPDYWSTLLVTRTRLIARLRHDWALYPDHVVFLGAKAAIINHDTASHEVQRIVGANPPYIFFAKCGVYENVAATPAQRAQLRCYYEVIARQSDNQKLRTLGHEEVAHLLDWDAERYRLSKSGSVA